MADSGDSPLSIAANWISIVTFITTSLGGLTILYTFYKQFEKAEEDLVAYGNVLAESSKVLIADIDAIEPIIKRFPLKLASLENTFQMYEQIRELVDKLERSLRVQSPGQKGLRRFVGTWKLGRNTEPANTVREIQRITPSLSAMKINLLFWRLEEQDELLKKSVRA
ncbi:hypothetical protein BU26DRAFT_562899 [Trematosphaeria pertusa]|uniref:Uncharacterized protein n=1 Tax=Trematosphaeria pertusa TaxID=390896 RepID=A0A6A6IKM1_9PLEO|nr:uncharacterized protein BU26DRAFT_562899 [Trematosphaeria pertusa]KAF2250936.1 hypothetical protein BU26DRAFT_562899 [Trematosphaeria pertusa]